ncbi:unnamed protein product [Sphenostylis stenocarpa]|uniref:Uncharacterized protein n=1 Tax=Sphenostylis stenocarpa TaxID=92480 RepID=A0AA86SGN6_9FABA|nr:unnamed protein product [Sphenostylis stenocarpa]
MTQASGLILNTFDQLEAPIISKLTTIFPKVYTIGPLHTLIKTQIADNSSLSLHLRKEDKSCITWLDQQKDKSVLYVSFGTLAKVSSEQLLEFWHGLVASLKPFLWVIRKDLIIREGGLGHNNVPMELELRTKEREGLWWIGHPKKRFWLILQWTINSRCVSAQWRIGIDMNGTCDRLVVEKMVKNVMENQSRLTSFAYEIAKQAHDSVKENGSSLQSVENLIKDIKSMKVIRN